MTRVTAGSRESAMTTPIASIMSRSVVTLSPDQSIREAMQLLAMQRLSGAPVVTGGRVIGVISATDLAGFASELPGVPVGHDEHAELEDWETAPEWTEGDDSPAAYFTEMWSDAGADVEERIEDAGSPEWDALSEHTVAEAMTAEVCALPPTATVVAAADYMRRANVHRIIVLDHGHLVGVLSAMDIARAIGEGKLGERRTRFDREPPRGSTE